MRRLVLSDHIRYLVPDASSIAVIGPEWKLQCCCLLVQTLGQCVKYSYGAPLFVENSRAVSTCVEPIIVPECTSTFELSYDRMIDSTCR